MKVKDKFQPGCEFDIEEAIDIAVGSYSYGYGELEQIQADINGLKKLLGILLEAYVGQSVDRLNEVAGFDRFTEVEE